MGTEGNIVDIALSFVQVLSLLWYLLQVLVSKLHIILVILEYRKYVILFSGSSRPCKVNSLSTKVLSIDTSEFTITLHHAFFRRDLTGHFMKSPSFSSRLSFHCYDLHWATWSSTFPILKNKSNRESACLILLWGRMLNFDRV